MPRPPRLQVAGGLYHVTASSNTGRIAFAHDDEREMFLALLAEVVQRRGWSCRSFCLLSTHYHLLVLTPEPDLAAGMQFLNGRYGQWANWRREEDGHVFKGRYGARFVTSEGHALECHRYIALNPVRAGLVRDPLAWPWGSLPALLGRCAPPDFLDLQSVYDEFGPAVAAARRRLRSFIRDGLAQDAA
ncbi:MAG TPA: transposase [Gaiellaceae bacterium]|nr:transposase [Gaiellaceae bacterium]